MVNSVPSTDNACEYRVASAIANIFPYSLHVIFKVFSNKLEKAKHLFSPEAFKIFILKFIIGCRIKNLQKGVL